MRVCANAALLSRCFGVFYFAVFEKERSPLADVTSSAIKARERASLQKVSDKRRRGKSRATSSHTARLKDFLLFKVEFLDCNVCLDFPTWFFSGRR